MLVEELFIIHSSDLDMKAEVCDPAPPAERVNTGNPPLRKAKNQLEFQGHKPKVSHGGGPPSLNEMSKEQEAGNK